MTESSNTIVQRALAAVRVQEEFERQEIMGRREQAFREIEAYADRFGIAVDIADMRLSEPPTKYSSCILTQSLGEHGVLCFYSVKRPGDSLCRAEFRSGNRQYQVASLVELGRAILKADMLSEMADPTGYGPGDAAPLAE